MNLKNLSKTDTTINEIDKKNEIDEKLLEYFKKTFVNRNKYTLKQINNRCIKHNLTINDLIEEVINKKSPLSRTQRDFLITFKPESIQEWIEELNEG